MAKISRSDEQSELTVDAPSGMNGGTAPQAADPFSDLAQFRLGQDFGAVLGIKKVITVVPVRKPSRQEFFQVHSDPAFRLETAILELKGEDKSVFLVDRALWSGLAGEISPRVIFTCISRQGSTFLWPVRRPGADGRVDNWSSSALAAAQLAMGRWVRIVANMGAGSYDTFTGSEELSPPEWPLLPFQDLMRRAFQGWIISS